MRIFWVSLIYLLILVSQMHATIRWGILSTARFNDKIIETIQRSKNSEVSAVASRSLDNALSYTAARNIPKAYGSYEELLDDPDIDVIFIPLPNSLHAQWTIKAISAGKHVLCEKPMATSLKEFEEIERLANLHDVIVFEGFAYAFHPQTIALLEILKSQKIGDIQLINSWFHIELPLLMKNGLPIPDHEQIRLDPALDGGCLWDLGAYCSSISLLIAQAGEPTEVWAHSIKGPTGVDIITTGHLKFANQVIARFSLSFYAPYHAKVLIHGTKGTIALDAPWRPGFLKDSCITFLSEFDSEEKIAFPKSDPYAYEIEAMEKGILDGIKPFLSLELSKSFLRTLLSLQQSAETGKVVRLESHYHKEEPQKSTERGTTENTEGTERVWKPQSES